MSEAVKVEEEEEAPESIPLAQLRRMHVCVCEMTAEESEQYDAGSDDEHDAGTGQQQQQQQAASDSEAADGDSSDEDAAAEEQPSFSGVADDPLRCRRKSRRGGRARNKVQYYTSPYDKF